MIYNVTLTDSAKADLVAISEYISKADSLDKADQLLGNIRKQFENLSQFPHRGVVPDELASMGNEFREIFFKPYRIIYEVINSTVYIYIIADGRRNMEMLLRDRLLRP